MRLMLGETRDQVHGTRGSLEESFTQLRAQLAHLEELAQRSGDNPSRIADLEAQLEQAISSRRVEHRQILEILRYVQSQSHTHREQLRALRERPSYEAAYSAADPLISVVIPTYDNHRILRERAIPSVLNQTYENFEIVVVGDAAPDETRTSVEGFGDPRISFFNLGYRGPYPEDPETRWLVAGVPPYNEAVRRATGLWIAPLDDDDAFRPHHLERLLAHARDERLELAYGRLGVHMADGGSTTIGCFPPELGQFGVQSAMYHAGLANIFELDLADAALGLPYDWALCLRMLEAGVRISMVDEVTVDYFPSRSWTPRWTADSYGLAPEAGASNGTEAAQSPVPETCSQRAVSPAPPTSEWEYVPEGWERARRPGETSSLGWNVEDVARSYRQKWPQFLQAVEGPGPLGVNHEMPSCVRIGRHDLIQQNAILAYAYALARAANGRETLSLLDWGGALGHYLVLARELLPELSFEYHCRELPAVCAEGRNVLPEANFHDSDDCLGSRYDIVVASSSLQYEESWQDLLRRLTKAAGNWLFLSRLPIAELHPSFVVLQRAAGYGYATEYLGWVFNRNELMQCASAAGLELEREFILQPPSAIAGAPDQVSYAAFLFRTD